MAKFSYIKKNTQILSNLYNFLKVLLDKNLTKIELNHVFYNLKYINIFLTIFSHNSYTKKIQKKLKKLLTFLEIKKNFVIKLLKNISKLINIHEKIKNLNIYLTPNIQNSTTSTSPQIYKTTFKLFFNSTIHNNITNNNNNYYYVCNIIGKNLIWTSLNPLYIYLFGNNVPYQPLIINTLISIKNNDKLTLNTYTLNYKNGISYLQFYINASFINQNSLNELLNFTCVQLYTYDSASSYGYTTVSTTEIIYRARARAHINFEKAFLTFFLNSGYKNEIRFLDFVNIIIVQNLKFPFYNNFDLYNGISGAYYLSNIPFNDNNQNLKPYAQTPLQYSCYDFTNLGKSQQYVFQLIGSGGNGGWDVGSLSVGEYCSMITGSGAGAYSLITVNAYKNDYKLNFFTTNFSSSGNPILYLSYQHIYNKNNTIEYTFNIGNGGDYVKDTYTINSDNIQDEVTFPSLIPLNGSLSTLQIIINNNGQCSTYLTTNYNSYNNYMNETIPVTTLNGIAQTTPTLINGYTDEFIENVILIEGYNGGSCTLDIYAGNGEGQINVNALSNGYTISGVGQIISSNSASILYPDSIYNPISNITSPLNTSINVNLYLINNSTSKYKNNQIYSTDNMYYIIFDNYTTYYDQTTFQNCLYASNSIGCGTLSQMAYNAIGTNNNINNENFTYGGSAYIGCYTIYHNQLIPIPII